MCIRRKASNLRRKFMGKQPWETMINSVIKWCTIWFLMMFDFLGLGRSWKCSFQPKLGCPIPSLRTWSLLVRPLPGVPLQVATLVENSGIRCTRATSCHILPQRIPAQPMPIMPLGHAISAILCHTISARSQGTSAASSSRRPSDVRRKAQALLTKMWRPQEPRDPSHGRLWTRVLSLRCLA